MNEIVYLTISGLWFLGWMIAGWITLYPHCKTFSSLWNEIKLDYYAYLEDL